MSLFDVRSVELSVDEVTAAVRHPGSGGIALFLGVVRDHNDGRAVVKLEYEAYGSMAVAEMKRIAEEIEKEIPGVRLAAVHRVGALLVGDAAIVCAASAPHRGEAFRAVRLLIDRIKAQVPIWKREHGPEGAYWVGWEDARCVGEHAHEHLRRTRSGSRGPEMCGLRAPRTEVRGSRLPVQRRLKPAQEGKLPFRLKAPGNAWRARPSEAGLQST